MYATFISLAAAAPLPHAQAQTNAELRFIIQQVQHYYGEGWNSLLIEVTWIVGLIVLVVAGALGVIAPVYLQWNFLRKLRKQLKVQHQRIADAKNEIAKIRQEIDKDKDEIETRLTRVKHFAVGINFLMRAYTHKMPEPKAHDLLAGALELAQSDETDSLKEAIEFYTKLAPKPNASWFESDSTQPLRKRFNETSIRLQASQNPQEKERGRLLADMVQPHSNQPLATPSTP